MRNPFIRIHGKKFPFEIEFGWFPGEPFVPFSIVVLSRVDEDFFVVFNIQIAKLVLGLYYSD